MLPHSRREPFAGEQISSRIGDRVVRTSTPRLLEIAIWNDENWRYEDFEIGQRARSIRRTISEGESMLFTPSCSTCISMSPTMSSHREEGMFGRRLAAGSMVFRLGLMAHNNIHTFS